MKNVTVVGGGIVGLCSAYYLQEEGFQVTVIDKGNITDGCSFGNMGFISPSHFMPLASPGIIAEGFKYMLSSSSPFYIKPRLDIDLIKWAIKFYRSSNSITATKNSAPLYNLLKLSRALISELHSSLDRKFDLQEIGCLMMCRQEKTLKHEFELADEAERLGLKVDRLHRQQVQALEPDVEVDVSGAVLFKDDCHFEPGTLMLALKEKLTEKGITFRYETTVKNFSKEKGSVKSVLTDKGSIPADQVVIASGSWLPETAAMLGTHLLLQPGKGYSYTYDHVEKNIKYPAILVDGRCAISPWKNKLRIGGTMELSGINNKVLLNRMKGIYESAKLFYPGLEIEPPEKEKIWNGLRPVTPDGLPYIGKISAADNVIIAGGHAMLGLSAGAATGKLVSQLASNKKTEIDISAFDVRRF